MKSFAEFLKKREQGGNLRSLTPIDRLADGHLLAVDEESTQSYLDFSSNDYLALTLHPKVIESSKDALLQMGTGAGAARLMSGSLKSHHLLEEEVAQLKGCEAALIFGSGYLANIGVIPALVGRHDLLLSDRLNHASIYDGCRLSGAKTHRFHHNNMEHLEDLLKKHRGAYQKALIVVESIYSMDGDRAPLKDIVALKKKYDCLLMVDEAHATGIFGPTGAGIIEEDKVVDDVDIAMGTFGKALGSYGAFIAASHQFVQYLINQARSFIYSTALPPAVIAASRASLHLIKTEPKIRQELHSKVELFKKYLSAGGFSENLGPSQIVPVVVGSSEKAVAMVGEFRAKHIFTTAVRPPTVPEGSARIRFSITRHHQPPDLQQAAETLLSILNR